MVLDRRAMRPPGRGDFLVSNFHPGPSLEIWRKTISGSEGGSGEEVGWPVLGYLLGKNYRRRDRDRLVPPRWMDAAVYRAEVCYRPDRRGFESRRPGLAICAGSTRRK